MSLKWLLAREEVGVAQDNVEALSECVTSRHWDAGPEYGVLVTGQPLEGKLVPNGISYTSPR